MERLTDDRFLKEGFYQPKSKEEEKEIRSMGNDLTFEKLYKHCAEVERQNAELQKQVDELKESANGHLLTSLYKKQADDHKRGLSVQRTHWEKKVEQAVKDTAKEMLIEFNEWINGQYDAKLDTYSVHIPVHEVNDFLTEKSKEYGVEVE